MGLLEPGGRLQVFAHGQDEPGNLLLEGGVGCDAPELFPPHGLQYQPGVAGSSIFKFPSRFRFLLPVGGVTPPRQYRS